MGENIKDDHVASIGGKPFQPHYVVSGQFLRPGLLPCLRKHFSDGSGFPWQTVIFLNLIYQGHALLVGEQPKF